MMRIGFLILAVVYLMSVAVFFLLGMDKRNAIIGRHRISVALLLILSFFGGAFGGCFGLLMFHYNPRSVLLKVLIPLFLLGQSAVLFFLGYIVDVLPDIII